MHKRLMDSDESQVSPQVSSQVSPQVSPQVSSQVSPQVSSPVSSDVSPDVSPEDLMIAVERMVRHVRHSATTGGLSTAASSALARLGREGPHRLTDLARAEGVSQPNMTQLVTRMERAGLVRRSTDSTDGRGVLVAVTETGLDVFRERRAERTRALVQLIEELTEPEQHAVKVALPALARVIQDRQERS